jgi:hypothetical protein
MRIRLSSKSNDNINPCWPFVFKANIASLGLREIVSLADNIFGKIGANRHV